MSLREKLLHAEQLVQEHGNWAMFCRRYEHYRQLYDVGTAIELALDEQNLLTKYSFFERNFCCELVS